MSHPACEVTRPRIVRTEIEKLPVGCGVEMMEQIRDQLLQQLQQIIDQRAEKAEALRQKQEAQAQRTREAEEAKRRKQEEEAQRTREAAEALGQAESRLIWRLGHVDDYLKELGESKIEFEDVFDRLRVAEKLQEKIKPTLVKELVQNPDLSDEQLHERIERLVDEYLPAELDEDLEVDEADEDWR